MNTQTAKEIAENRHNIIVKFIEEFFERMVKINYKIIKNAQRDKKICLFHIFLNTISFQVINFYSPAFSSQLSIHFS